MPPPVPPPGVPVLGLLEPGMPPVEGGRGGDIQVIVNGAGDPNEVAIKVRNELLSVLKGLKRR